MSKYRRSIEVIQCDECGKEEELKFKVPFLEMQIEHETLHACSAKCRDALRAGAKGTNTYKVAVPIRAVRVFEVADCSTKKRACEIVDNYINNDVDDPSLHEQPDMIIHHNGKARVVNND